jgi:hypothetical protein
VRALVRHAGLRSFLLTEMVARMAKQILRQRFRVYLKPKETLSQVCCLHPSIHLSQLLLHHHHRTH